MFNKIKNKIEKVKFQIKLSAIIFTTIIITLILSNIYLNYKVAKLQKNINEINIFLEKII